MRQKPGDLAGGRAAPKDLKLTIADQSIAGHVALARKIVNIRDVYDEGELKAIHPQLRFLQEVDKRTGYRTKQMLVAPIVDLQNGELMGVAQLINNRAGVPFAAVAEEGIKGLSETLAIAFSQRNKPAQVAKSKYDHLVLDAIIAAPELELATRTARRKNVDVEEILITEMQVTPDKIGAALSKFFGVPYEPFRNDRIKPSAGGACEAVPDKQVARLGYVNGMAAARCGAHHRHRTVLVGFQARQRIDDKQQLHAASFKASSSSMLRPASLAAQ